MKHSDSRILLSPIVLVMLLILGACSGNNVANISDLLATVPNDASAVVAFNVRSALEKAGCTVEGSKVTMNKTIEKALENSSGSDIKRFFNGEYGVDPSAAVIFVEGHEIYLTGYLAQPSQFKKAVEKETGAPFEGSPVETSGNIALKTQQFWVRLSHKNEINTDEIARFTSLTDRLSFLANDYGDNLADLNHDIKGWSNIIGLFNTAGLDFQSRSLLRMIMESVFEDAEDLTFEADFEKGRFVAVTRILNENGDPAKYLLPAEKIDISAIDKAPETANFLMAIATPERFISEIRKQVGDKGISVIGAILPMLECVDGTTVAAIGTDGSFSGIIPTNGNGTSRLADLLSTQLNAQVSKDGNNLLFSHGTVSGPIVTKDVASRFKGASIGLVMTPATNPGAGDPSIGLKDISVMFEGTEGSLQLRLEAESIDQSENILISVLQNAAPKK